MMMRGMGGELTEAAGGRGRRADLDGLGISEHGLDEGSAGEPGGHDTKHSAAAAMGGGGITLGRSLLLGSDGKPGPGDGHAVAAGNGEPA